MKINKVLVAPLNWGLGHTTRIIPIVKVLKELHAEIYFGGSQVQMELMKQEFESIHYITFPSVAIRFGRQKYQMLSFLFQLPGFIFQVFREKRLLEKLIKSEDINLVISDNVYGLWNRNAYTVFITHQLSIFLPHYIKWVQKIANWLSYWCISKYNECWIPDLEDSLNLAGKLSHPKLLPNNTRYIGILSRFEKFEREYKNMTIKRNSVLILLSGPEPQRSFFEKIITEQLSDLPDQMKCNVIRGKPGETNNPYSGWINHLPAFELGKLIVETEYIICRSGYSTIMDLVSLKKTALLVPTPGQTEQEYLAARMHKKGWFCIMQQDNFKLSKAIQILKGRKKSANFNRFHSSSLNLILKEITNSY